jgi:N-carbamoyl-L-amino-acid hydrolase
MSSAININRVWSRIEELAGFSDPQIPFTRRSFSEYQRKSREWLRQQFQKAGLATWTDAGGNLIGRLEGRNKKLYPIMTGSHMDTVIGGGRFDGVAGVIAGLEVVQMLAENHEQLNHPLEVIDFLAEEPSDYGISCIGSRALAGALSPEMLEKKAPDESTLAQGIDNFGGDSSKLARSLRLNGNIAGFFELHIEQGKVLESAGLSIGIVTEIVGITRVLLKMTGRVDHAGTTPMDLRRDALVGAAKIVLYINELAQSKSKDIAYLVATVGKIAVKPNNANVVPGDVEMTLEVRSSNEKIATDFLDFVQGYARQTADLQMLAFTSQLLSHTPPTPCSKPVQDAIQQACEKKHITYQFMASGAGHDTRYMTSLCPSGMIFIPCLNGRSHCPEEWTTKEQLAIGVTSLLDAIKFYDHENP